jgi:hypothetical protein
MAARKINAQSLPFQAPRSVTFLLCSAQATFKVHSRIIWRSDEKSTCFPLRVPNSDVSQGWRHERGQRDRDPSPHFHLIFYVISYKIFKNLPPLFCLSFIL